MKTQILRRKKLGRSSCNGISNFWSNNLERDVRVVRSDWEQVDCDVLFRWGCTAQTQGVKFQVNTSDMIHTMANKLECRRDLEDISPPTHFNKSTLVNNPFSFDNNAMWIGRPATHSQGRNAVFCRSVEDVMNDTTSSYWSLFIPKQKEYRIYVLFGKILCVAEKIPTDPNAVLWNKAQNGSTFVNVKWSDWPMECINHALCSQYALGVDFAGIDVMEHYGHPYILELNSAPTLSSPYRQQCFARGFEWVVQQIEELGRKPYFFQLNVDAESWKDVIHPAISGANGGVA